MSAIEVLSSMPREKLEEQLIKNLKFIKSLKKQNLEAIASVEELDNKLKNQIEENNRLVDIANKLQEENDRLLMEQQKSSNSTAAIAITNIGKTISKVISQKKNDEMKLDIGMDITTISPTMQNDNDEDSPHIKALKIELNSLQTKLNSSNENEQKMKQQIIDIETKNKENENKILNLQEAYDKYLKENDKLNQENNELKIKLKNIEEQFSNLKVNSSVMESRLPALIQAENDLKQVTESRDSLNEQYEKIKNEVITLRVKNEENERQINQYKDGLKKAMRVDKERENELHQLQNKIADLEIEKQDLLKQIENYNTYNNSQDSRENDLKEKIKMLESRLETGKASEESENKIKKMNKMLEKSNVLYAELQEKYAKIEQRSKDLEIKLHHAKVPGIPIIKFIGPKSFYILYDNGIYQENIDNSSVSKTVNYYDSIKKDKGIQPDENGPFFSYSEQMMRTYFMADENTRRDISPVLMKILQFTDDEIKKELTKKKSGFHFF